MAHRFREGTLLLLKIIAFLSIVGCSDVIVIERVATWTPTPRPTATSTATPDASTVTTEAPTRIVVEKISLDAEVVEMGWETQENWQGELISEWVVPENEAGWHINSAKPGQGSNVVISGHNASLGGHVFADIEGLEIGDLIGLYNDEGFLFTYQVQESTIVRTFAGPPESELFLQESMAPTETERLTLITCWPSWTNTHRLVIVAEPYSG